MTQFIRRSVNALSTSNLRSQLHKETNPPLESTRGFGCPFNEYQCDAHCRNDLKKQGGYCGGNWLKTTCICI